MLHYSKTLSLTEDNHRARTRPLTLVFFPIAVLSFFCNIFAYGMDSSSLTQLPENEIFILDSAQPGHPWSDKEVDTIVDGLRKKKLSSLPIIEYMDYKRHPKGEHAAELTALMHRKYQDQKFSLIFALDEPAFNFALKNHKDIFSNAPIIFMGVNNFTPELLAGDTRVTGIVDFADPSGNIEIMLRLHPNVKEILILHDYTPSGLAIRKNYEAVIPGYADRIRFRFTDNLPVEVLFKELEGLPQDALVLNLTYTTDQKGRTFAQEEITEQFSRHSSVPIYDRSATRLGYGIVGGKLIDAQVVGMEAVAVAERILRGDDIRNIPVRQINSSRYMFDYRQLERFHIPITALPPESIIINKPIPFFVAYRNLALAALGVMVFMVLMIVFLIAYSLQRRRMTKALRDSERKYLDLYENAPDMYLSIDAKTTGVIECNNTVLRATGYAREEIIGKPVLNLYDPDCIEDARRVFHQFVTTGEVNNAELKVRRKDNTAFDVILNASAVRDKGGNIIHSRSIWRDITDRKQAENALRHEQKRAQSYLDTVDTAIVALNTAGGITTINRRGCQVLGYEETELIGENWFSTCLSQPDGMEIVHPYFLKLIAGKVEAVEYFENSIVTRSGELRQFAWHNALMRDEQGLIIGILSNGEDITERRRAEEEKRSLEERLQRAEKMEALGTLAGGVAHDMNNILGILTGYSELLQERIPEGNPLRSYADNILSASLKGAAIIEDLLTMARRGVTSSEVVNVNDLIANFSKSSVFDKIKTHYPQVKFIIELSPNLLNIRGSSVHLDKTLMNLVSNAVESIAHEGVVAIKTENRYLDKPVPGYEQMREGDYVVLTVSDTGSGIARSDREKIFEPFYTKKKMGRSGTGLGLAIVWGTVKDHVGHIDLQSEVGKGTTFTLYFPVTREDLALVQKQLPLEQYMGMGESILVVDDIREQREIAANILTWLNYQVQVAASGEEAIAYLRTNHVDLLLLDMIMDPGIDGLETYRRVIEFKPKQKAIIVSGFSATDRVTEALRLGAGVYVKKPYLKEKIGVAVRQELDRK